MAKSKKKNVKFLVSGMVTWLHRSGKETRRYIEQGKVLKLRVDEDHLTGGYRLWDGSASIIMDKAKVEISD
ncbi:MAG: hypothetical protein ABSF26_21495 [Thermoguttaceae bacterium]|jgi:hypothetical protein